MEEKLCYVCSPYRGDVARNVKYAKEPTGRAVRRGRACLYPEYKKQKVSQAGVRFPSGRQPGKVVRKPRKPDFTGI